MAPVTRTLCEHGFPKAGPEALACVECNRRAHRNVRLDEVLAAIRAHRFRFANERQLQVGVAIALEKAGLDPRLEVRLSPEERVDLVCDVVGIEVKVAGTTRAVLRQLTRYAKYDEIAALVLVTTRAHYGLPATLFGKPLRIVNLMGAGL